MIYLALALSAAVPTSAGSLEQGFAGALRGCEEWVVNPASWIDGPEPFLKTVGLGGSIGLVKSIPEIALPPEEFRMANHYWRVNSTAEAGYFLVVSDRLPICHITGGGPDDLQPVVGAVVASSDFLSRWEWAEDKVQGDMLSSRYRLRKMPNFEIIVSRAAKPGGRTDRVQVLATANLSPSK